MVISQDHIEHLAKLARLGITEAEKKKYAKQISSILDYFEQLKEIDTKNVAPMAHVFGLKNVVQEDKVKQSFSQEKVLAEAPEIEKKQIKVKKVLSHK
jgi:aspartyl-tRNA(Asn)/glutamyl-tRNA(Gln) amidotransferase subunit C